MYYSYFPYCQFGIFCADSVCSYRQPLYCVLPVTCWSCNASTIIQDAWCGSIKQKFTHERWWWWRRMSGWWDDSSREMQISSRCCGVVALDNNNKRDIWNTAHVKDLQSGRCTSSRTQLWCRCWQIIIIWDESICFYTIYFKYIVNQNTKFIIIYSNESIVRCRIIRNTITEHSSDRTSLFLFKKHIRSFIWSDLTNGLHFRLLFKITIRTTQLYIKSARRHPDYIYSYIYHTHTIYTCRPHSHFIRKTFAGCFVTRHNTMLCVWPVCAICYYTRRLNDYCVEFIRGWPVLRQNIHRKSTLVEWQMCHLFYNYTNNKKRLWHEKHENNSV